MSTETIQVETTLAEDARKAAAEAEEAGKLACIEREKREIDQKAGHARDAIARFLGRDYTDRASIHVGDDACSYEVYATVDGIPLWGCWTREYGMYELFLLVRCPACGKLVMPQGGVASIHSLASLGNLLGREADLLVAIPDHAEPGKEWDDTIERLCPTSPKRRNPPKTDPGPAKPPTAAQVLVASMERFVVEAVRKNAADCE